MDVTREKAGYGEGAGAAVILSFGRTGEYCDEFETYIHSFNERPGLTGLALINGGFFPRLEEKAFYDPEYISVEENIRCRAPLRVVEGAAA